MRRLALLLPLVACAPAPSSTPLPQWRSLLHHDAWHALEAGADPLADHRPDPLHCAPDAWLDDGGWTEVRTEDCDYVALAQPSAAAIEPGDLLRVTIAWGRLFHPDPAEGHIALLVGDEPLVDRTVPIPAPAEAHTITWLADKPYAAATPIILHVHNHGANTWQLFDFARRR